MSNKELSRALRFMVSLMELHDENPFKIKSYSFAAQAVERYPQPVANLPLADIYSIKGIGRSMGDVITQLAASRTTPLLDELIAKTPEGILQMLQIKGIGAKKVSQLWRELGIESAGELLYACNENRLVALKGFGEKTQQNIQKSIEYMQANTGLYRYATLEAEALALTKALEALPYLQRLSLTAELRRKCELVSQIEMVVVCNAHTDQLIADCTAAQMQLNAQHEQQLHFTTAIGTPLVLHLSTAKRFAYTLLLTTGSAAHLQALPIDDTLPTHADTEQALYSHLQLPYILPEWREGRNELRLAQQNALPTDTIRTEHIRGVIHAHSTYSDGQHSLYDMALACQTAGYEYLGISDHSKAAFYANGLSEERVAEQHREIDRLNSKFTNFRIFKGIEADILYNGDLDYTPDVLQSFDFVIASVHSNLKMPLDKAMHRLLRAIENPYTTLLGHPTGRLLLSREGYPIDHQRIIDACAHYGVAIELNASPYRLDIDWRWIEYCTHKGVPISINPDAHSVEGITDIRYGVYAARKGMLAQQHTLNTFNTQQISDFFAQKRSRVLSTT